MTNPRLFEDLAELAGGAVGVLTNLRQQLKDEARARVGGALGKTVGKTMSKAMDSFDLVTQDDLERLTGMVAKARSVQEDILKRLSAIEKKLGLKAVNDEPAPKTKAATKAKSKPAKKKKA